MTMKKIIAIAAAMLLALCASAQSSKSLYNKYSGEKGISAVYISPAMFRLIGKLPELELADEDVDISRIIKSLEGMYILSTENLAMGTRICDDVDKLLRSGKYELLMEAKDDGEVMKMYTVTKGELITSFVMLSVNDDEVDFIGFDGQIRNSDFEALIAESQK